MPDWALRSGFPSRTGTGVVAEESYAVRIIESLINLTVPTVVLNYQRRLTPVRPGELVVDRKVSRDEALNVVAQTTWAKGWAAGLCRFVAPALRGMEKSECEERLARQLAEKVLP